MPLCGSYFFPPLDVDNLVAKLSSSEPGVPPADSKSGQHLTLDRPRGRLPMWLRLLKGSVTGKCYTVTVLQTTGKFIAVAIIRQRHSE